jgi:hypothetical protein
MTKVQLLALGIAIVLPLSVLLYSSSRSAGDKQTIRAEIGEGKHALRAEMEVLRADTAAGLARVQRAIARFENKFVVHDPEHRN